MLGWRGFEIKNSRKRSTRLWEESYSLHWRPPVQCFKAERMGERTRRAKTGIAREPLQAWSPLSLFCPWMHPCTVASIEMAPRTASLQVTSRSGSSSQSIVNFENLFLLQEKIKIFFFETVKYFFFFNL